MSPSGDERERGGTPRRERRSAPIGDEGAARAEVWRANRRVLRDCLRGRSADRRRRAPRHLARDGGEALSEPRAREAHR